MKSGENKPRDCEWKDLGFSTDLRAALFRGLSLQASLQELTFALIWRSAAFGVAEMLKYAVGNYISLSGRLMYGRTNISIS